MGARLKAVWGWLRENWPYLAVVVFIILVAGAALIYLPDMRVPKDAYWLDTKTIFDMKNEALRTIAYIIGGLLAVIGIIQTFRRIRALERQVQIAQKGQITERWTRAIEQLGSDKVAIRFGGIYALERIAKDSDEDYWPIMETLTAVVRVAPRREPPADSPYMDIQAILTVLARRKYHFGQGENQPLDLRGSDLRGADLRGAHLERAALGGVHLERAILDRARLEGASFGEEAHLERAFLREAHLEGAILMGAHLEGGFLSEAHLEKADLTGAHLKEEAILRGAHLEKAILENAHLEGADLSGAHLDGAFLHGAHLEGANLMRTTDLTRQQLAAAIIDKKTILPDYL
jgi:uncharacterized protein YjbI with pentapeptide repeats